LVGREDGPQVGGGSSSRRKQADKRTAFAAKVAESFGGTATAEAPAAEAPAEPEVAAEEAPATEAEASDAGEEKTDGEG
jgi:hypothetical protein